VPSATRPAPAAAPSAAPLAPFAANTEPARVLSTLHGQTRCKCNIQSKYTLHVTWSLDVRSVMSTPCWGLCAKPCSGEQCMQTDTTLQPQHEHAYNAQQASCPTCSLFCWRQHVAAAHQPPAVRRPALRGPRHPGLPHEAAHRSPPPGAAPPARTLAWTALNHSLASRVFSCIQAPRNTGLPPLLAVTAVQV